MKSDDYERKTYNILCAKNFNRKLHRQNLNKYDFGNLTPIDDELLLAIPEGKVILSEGIYKALQLILGASSESKSAMTFFLFGHEIDDNMVFFDEIIASEVMKRKELPFFSREMVQYLARKLTSGNLVVCHGHAHPPIGNFSSSFTVGDFASYIKMNENNKVFSNKEAELMACLVSCAGNLKFVYYDLEKEDFFRFAEVYRKDSVDNLELISGLEDTKQKRR